MARLQAAVLLVLVAALFAGYAPVQVLGGGVNSTLLPKQIIVKVSINGVPVNADSSSVFVWDTDVLTVTWKLNESLVGVIDDSSYKTVFLKLCFGAVSAVDRPWRKNNNDLLLSKTCKYAIKRQPYTAAGNNVTYKPPDTVPSALYFVRAFVLNTTDPTALPGHAAVALGSSTNAFRNTTLFKLEGYTGRSTPITIAIVCFSVASYVALVGFFVIERAMKKRS